MMNRRASYVILAATTVLVIALLAAEAADPVLYTAENITTGAHADPKTIDGQKNNAAAVVPLMDELLDQTGTLTLTIKLRDYESAERDLARYSELTSRFDRLVITLDASETELGEFQRNNRKNLEALDSLLNDTRRFDHLQRLEIQVQDGDQRRAIAYEGEALRQKMQKTYSAYASRESVMTGIGERYSLNTTPYRESVGHFSEIVDAADDWHRATAPQQSPLGITVTPAEGRYGETIRIAGRYAGGTPGTPVEIYIDSRAAGTATLNADGTYAWPYRIDRVAAGPHLVYAAADAVYSGVESFQALPDETAISLAVAGASGTTVTCTGNLTTIEGLPVAGAPVSIRVDGETLVDTETGEDGTYEQVIALPAGEHTLRAEFHGGGFPLNASESETATIVVRGEGPPLIPFVAALAAAAGTAWYLRRRETPEAAPIPQPSQAIVHQPPPKVEIADLAPREAATVLFGALRDRLGIKKTKTPRDCARIAPDYAWFFERYEQIRYGGEEPTKEEIRRMKDVILGGDEAAA